MYRWLSLLMVVVLIATAALACGGDGNEKEQPSPSPTGEKPSPTITAESPSPTGAQPSPTKVVPTGTLTMAVQTIAVRPWIGPFSMGETTEKPYWAPVFDFLVYDAGKDDYVPGLAESWKVAEDGMSITFKLRQGVQFHDGWGEMTSEDVRFTIETVLNPDVSQCSNCQTNFGSIFDHVETNGPYEVTVYVTKARAEDVLGWMCPSHAHGIGISSKAYYESAGHEKANERLIGTGPYKFASFEMGSKLTLEAVGDHWRVVPQFKTIVIKEIPELTTRAAMLQTGEADIAEVTPDQAAYLEGRKFAIVTVPKARYLSLSLLGQWLPERPTYDPGCPFLDKRVREAMNLAINREEIAQTIFKGYAKPASMNFHSPHADTLQPYPYDPQRAKQLLAEAGYPSGFKTEILDVAWAGSAGMTELMSAVQGYWQKVGIDAKITSSNVIAIYGTIVGRKNTGKCISFFGSVSYAPYYQGATIWGYSKNAMFPMYESPEFDKLVEAYFDAFTAKERDSFGAQMVQHLYDNYNLVPLLNVDAIFAAGKRVGEWKPANWNYLSLEHIARSGG
ncbi:MAG: ABC transporter substrate-binding protein [Chloroflexi bacterium]|nr:ABC transporter substrate-binding protein [Chloroflexota bacterium]